MLASWGRTEPDKEPDEDQETGLKNRPRKANRRAIPWPAEGGHLGGPDRNRIAWPVWPATPGPPSMGKRRQQVERRRQTTRFTPKELLQGDRPPTRSTSPNGESPWPSANMKVDAGGQGRH